MMNSLATAVIALGCLLLGIGVGSMIRNRLPNHHVQDDSRDVLKLASGVIATLVALVIGLLVGSAKSSFDQTSGEITQMGAKLIMLDRALRRLGPDATAIRGDLSRGVTANVDQLWPKTAGAQPDLAAVERSTGLEDVQGKIAELPSTDETSRTQRSNALALSNDLILLRWSMIEQAQDTLPSIFLAILIFWLTVLFASFGLLAPRNSTAVASLLICAVSMAGAIFLFLEMDHPLDGLIQVSPAPLHKAIAVING